MEIPEQGTENDSVLAGWGSLSKTLQMIYLYRVRDRKESLLDGIEVDTDETSLEQFKLDTKRQYGGGRYLAVVRGESGEFIRKIFFSLEGLPKREEEDRPPATPTEAGGGFKELAALMLQQQAASEARFERLIAVMADKPKEDDLDKLLKFKEIIGGTGGVPKPEKTMLEQLTELQGIAGMFGWTLGGGNDDDSWWKDLLGELVPQFLAGHREEQEAGAAPAATPALAAPAAVVVPPAQQPNTMQRLRMLTAGLVQLAGYNVPPESVVPRVQQEAGDSWPALLQVMNQPNALDLAAKMVPAVRNHAEWFQKFRACALGGGSGSTGNDGGTAGDGGVKPAPRAPVPAVKRGGRHKADAS